MGNICKRLYPQDPYDNDPATANPKGIMGKLNHKKYDWDEVS